MLEHLSERDEVLIKSLMRLYNISQEEATKEVREWKELNKAKSQDLI